MPFRRATLFNLLAIGLLLGLAGLAFSSVRPPGSAAEPPTTTLPASAPAERVYLISMRAEDVDAEERTRLVAFDVPTRTVAYTVAGALDIRLSHDGAGLFVAFYDRLELLDARDGRTIWSLPSQQGRLDDPTLNRVDGIASLPWISADDSLLFVQYYERAAKSNVDNWRYPTHLRLIDARQGLPLGAPIDLDDHAHVALTRDGRLAYSLGATFKAIDLSDQTILLSRSESLMDTPLLLAPDERSIVTIHSEISPTLAAGPAEQAWIYQTDTLSATSQPVFQADLNEHIDALSLSPDGSRLLLKTSMPGSTARRLRVFDAASWQESRPISPDLALVAASSAWSGDSRHTYDVAVDEGGKSITLYRIDLLSGQAEPLWTWLPQPYDGGIVSMLAGPQPPEAPAATPTAIVVTVAISPTAPAIPTAVTATATLSATVLPTTPTALATPPAPLPSLAPATPTPAEPTATTPASPPPEAPAISPTPGLAPTPPITDTLAWLWWEGPRRYVTEQQRRMMSGGGVINMWVVGGPVMRLDQTGGQHPVAANVIRTVPRPDQPPLLITAPDASGSFTVTDPLSGLSVPVDINQTSAIPKATLGSVELGNDVKDLDDLSLSPDGALLAYSFSAYDGLDRMVRYDDEIGLTDLRTGVTATLYPGVPILRREAPRPYRWVIGWRGHTLYGGWRDGEQTSIWSFDMDTRVRDEHIWDAPAGGALAGSSSDWIIYSLPAEQEGLREYWFMPWGGEPLRLGRYQSGMEFAVSPALPWRIAFITPPWRAKPPETQEPLLLLGEIAGDFAPQVISDSLGIYSSVEWLSQRYLSLYEYQSDHFSLLDGSTGAPVAAIPYDPWGGSDRAAGPDDHVLWTSGDCSAHGHSDDQTLFYLETLVPGRAPADRLELGPAPLETSHWTDCVPPRIAYVPGAR
jgi:hypothetical protein